MTPDRVLPRVEPAHLHEQRVLGSHAVALAELLDERVGELEVLHRQRIDARRQMPDVVHRERRGHELRHRPDRRVVLLDEGPVEVPHRRVRVGEIDVAAPDPLRVGVIGGAAPDELAHRGRLRIVDDDEVPLAVELQRVVEDALEVDPLHRGVPLDVGALERVVHRLGDAEELVAAVDHLPLGFEADVAGERDVGGEQFGDTAAVRGRVDVQDAGTLEGLRQLHGCARRCRPRRRPRSRRGACRAAEHVRARAGSFSRCGAECDPGRSSGQSIARGPRHCVS